MIKKIKQKLIYEDAWLKFYQDEIEFPDGSKGTYAYGDRPNGALIVVVTKDKKILLQKEYRYPIKKHNWELPGGGIDGDESPKVAAIRELKEETGIKVKEEDLQKLGVFYPLNSLSTEDGTIFMVIIDNEDTHNNNTEGNEVIDDQQFFTFDEIYQMIDDGRIKEAFTANAVQIAIRKSNL